MSKAKWSCGKEAQYRWAIRLSCRNSADLQKFCTIFTRPPFPLAVLKGVLGTTLRYQVNYHTYMYLANGRWLSYTPSVEHVVSWTIRETQPFSDYIISREKRYQALSVFPYCKRQKAGWWLGKRLTLHNIKAYFFLRWGSWLFMHVYIALSCMTVLTVAHSSCHRAVVLQKKLQQFDLFASGDAPSPYMVWFHAWILQPCIRKAVITC